MDQNKVERRLSAIFYADIVGYSRLTEQDEVATHHKLLAYMDWIAKTINDHGGAVIKFAGDAVLAEFRSAVDALSCAAAIQKNPAEAQSHEADADTLKLRIGLNVGDIIAARDDIYGDGVNVAARLESLASAGGICISHSVLEQVRNKLEFGYEALGEQSVKNISEPVRAYRVILDPETAGEIKDAPKRAGRPAVRTAVLAMILLVGVLSTALWMIYPRYLSQTADEKSAQGEEYVSTSPSIAVLPFRNISGNAEEDYFSDGITQDITTDLSKFRALFVISSSAVLPFKGQSIPAQDVSEKLGVRYVLEGSVQRSADQVRVNAQLIEGATGRNVWADRFVRPTSELFELQDEIVGTIVATLATNVDAVERDRAMRKPTDDLEAYDFLLRGRELQSRSTASANTEAREQFRKAIEIDPRFADAYVALGQTYLDALRYGWTGAPSESLQKVHDLAQEALKLDERNPAAHRLLGFAYLKWQNFELATDEFKQALELNPNDADSLDALGSVWLYSGETDAAIDAIETALRYNPELPPSGLIHLGFAYYLEGRYDDAIKIFQTALGRSPNLVILHVGLTAAFTRAGRANEAEKAAATVRRLHPFFQVSQFANAFRDEADREAITTALLKAGLP